MIRLILFLKKIQPLLLFVVIILVCLWVFLENNAYQRAKMMAVSQTIGVGMYKQLTAISDYFALSEQNEILHRENAILHKRLSEYQQDTTLKKIDYPLEYYRVKVVRNTYTLRNNFLTLDGGLNQGIVPNMALFNSEGIVGYVKYCSANFSVAVSVLNLRDFRTSGELKGQEGQGSIRWDGVNYTRVIMDEIPAHTPLNHGDTVVTTQYSNIFPQGIPIGIVQEYEVQENLLIQAQLKLLADMSQLDYLYAVLLEGQKEREFLEQSIKQ